jgi:nucleoside-diphosphate-sugar epimerase
MRLPKRPSIEQSRRARTRDFIFVEDIMPGLIACALKGEPGETYNIASGVETTIPELTQLVNRLAGNTTRAYCLLPPS